MSTAWLMGRYPENWQEDTREAGQWEVMGVFTTEARARAAATPGRDFIWELALDEVQPQERVIWDVEYIQEATG